MALQLGAVRDAFIAANVPQEKANAAAEELAAFESRFSSVDRSLERIAGQVDKMTWMLGVVLVLLLALLWRVFQVHV
jgi:hypothetical protein